MPGLKVGTEIFRNHDQAFSKQLEKASSERRIRVDMRLSECDEGLWLELVDEQGIGAAVTLPLRQAAGRQPGAGAATGEGSAWQTRQHPVCGSPD